MNYRSFHQDFKKKIVSGLSLANHCFFFFLTFYFILEFSQLYINGHELKQSPGDSEDGEAWRVAIHGVRKSRTELCD